MKTKGNSEMKKEEPKKKEMEGKKGKRIQSKTMQQWLALKMGRVARAHRERLNQLTMQLWLTLENQTLENTINL